MTKKKLNTRLKKRLTLPANIHAAIMRYSEPEDTRSRELANELVNYYPDRLPIAAVTILEKNACGLEGVLHLRIDCNFTLNEIKAAIEDIYKEAPRQEIPFLAGIFQEEYRHTQNIDMAVDTCIATFENEIDPDTFKKHTLPKIYAHLNIGTAADILTPYKRTVFKKRKTPQE